MSSPHHSCDTLSLAVDIEHEVFKNSKSSNLYKAAVLKKVTAVCLFCCYLKETYMHLTHYFILKVAEMKKIAPASAGGEREDGCSDARDTGSQHKEEASSSSTVTEEPQGFTSASEIYSVRSP